MSRSDDVVVVVLRRAELLGRARGDYRAGMRPKRRRVTIARVPFSGGIVIALIAALIASAVHLVASIAADALLPGSSTIAHRLVESATLAFGVVAGVQAAIFLRHVPVELIEEPDEP